MEGSEMTGIEIGLVVVGGTLILPMVAAAAVFGVMSVVDVASAAMHIPGAIASAIM
tara:strand:+ start:2673 stop:2840 length:168 start_codon:yes stop_codon:yes gene_type:complete